MDDDAITILYIENNPLDRAVLDLHLHDSEETAGATKFRLRYSYEGRLVGTKDVLERQWRASSTMILFDLGLSAQQENLLFSPAVRELLSDNRGLTKYLASEGRFIPPNDRFEAFKKEHPDVWSNVEQITGLRALLEVRFNHPHILCGIVSHFVAEDIREVLEAFVMYGWRFDSTEYDVDQQPIPLVIHKGDLSKISQRLKRTWTAWQRVSNEFYCKDVIQNSLIQAADGSSTSLAGRVDSIRDSETLKPEDGQWPIFICDFLGLLDLKHSRLTLERLFKRVFPSLKMLAPNELSATDRASQYILVQDPGLALRDAVEPILRAYDGRSPKQLVCFVRGRAEDQDKVSQVFGDLGVPSDFWYTMPSLPAIMSNDTFTSHKFVESIVTSAFDYACYESRPEVKVKGGERFVNDLQVWLKSLREDEIPPSLPTFWKCACEVFQKQILTQKDVKELFGEKAKAERAEIRKRWGKGGF